MSSNRLLLLKRSHRAQIMQALRRHSSLSRVQLAQVTGLSVTCVCGLIEQLLREGALVEHGKSLGPRGGPKTLLEINPEGAPVAGIWLAPDTVHVQLANPRGEVLAQETRGFPAAMTPEAAVPLLTRALRHCARQAQKEVETLAGIGVSVAGVVDPGRGDIVAMANRQGWDGVPLARLLGVRLPVPIVVEHAVRAGALAAHWLDHAADDGDTCYVLVANGIGAAMIRQGEVCQGEHYAAVELGHTTIAPDGPHCGCGKQGCLERMASDMAFIRLIWPEVTENEAEMPSAVRERLVRQGVTAALQGDAHAHAALLAVTRLLGIGLANMVALLDPRTLRLGGTLLDAAPTQVLALIQRAMRAYLPTRLADVRVLPCGPYTAFMRRGPIGLILWEPFRQLREETRSAQDIAVHTRGATA